MRLLQSEFVPSAKPTVCHFSVRLWVKASLSRPAPDIQESAEGPGGARHGVHPPDLSWFAAGGEKIDDMFSAGSRNGLRGGPAGRRAAAECTVMERPARASLGKGAPPDRAGRRRRGSRRRPRSPSAPSSREAPASDEAADERRQEACSASSP